ncbi:MULTISPECIES: cupredoxin domain-containing protein [unclassified Streptomyces]|uniref:cupredoxin domain-containing protein n=1 Tax=unclassified Streptomyces TaxID=2593676 RepID=UPI0022527D10|nr:MULTISPECIES: cupredoxin domain-containing protein [unclassified Streptomyces]MCX4798850.1 cupredoxin domain-containing protein [Streptomyces sp. NBC_01242]WSJ40053.1 cupredoxin domain-containing protein [Streptomyces sp. NBC_01321]WSP66357.1 cupredoxin domain-containing protein [Streptomyces sp. NBC_01240]WSU25528.1 cupredoxin domain-containing protein [Streptomyces sp. NBC_01108]
MPASLLHGRAGVTAAAAIVFASALVGCSHNGGTGSSPTSATPSASATPSPSASASPSPPPVGRTRITIKNFAFAPAQLTVPARALITVVNEDAVAHTVTATAGATNGKTFDTGDIAPGKTATFTAPAKPGTYPYLCTIHPYMKGALTVR